MKLLVFQIVDGDETVPELSDPCVLLIAKDRSEALNHIVGHFALRAARGSFGRLESGEPIPQDGGLKIEREDGPDGEEMVALIGGRRLYRVVPFIMERYDTSPAVADMAEGFFLTSGHWNEGGIGTQTFVRHIGDRMALVTVTLLEGENRAVSGKVDILDQATGKRRCVAIVDFTAKPGRAIYWDERGTVPVDVIDVPEGSDPCDSHALRDLILAHCREKSEELAKAFDGAVWEIAA